MKNYLLLLSLAVLILASCKDDEPEIDPLVGEWELVEMEMVDLPNGFVNFEGVTDINVYGESLFTIEFNADMTFERTLRFSNGRVEDDGTWERDDDEIELDVEDDEGLPDTYVIVEDVDDDELLLSAEVTYNLLPDAVTDTATIDSQEELVALYEAYGQSVKVTVNHYFER
ncbi:MAG: lipocalin family protein [Marinoscillum sp.]